MTLQRPFRVSMLVLVLTGMVALTTSLGSWAWLLGTLAGWLGIAVWTALRPRWHLRRGVATVVVVLTGQLVVVEWLVAHSVLVPAAHFLLITQLVWLTQERTNRHYGWLCLMSLLQMMLAGVLSVNLAFGLCFLIYLPAGVCALLFYNLRCELERHGALRPSKMPRVGWRLLMGAGLVTVGELVLTVVVFMYFPRFGLQILQLKPVQRGARLSGFSDSVRFGDLARVLDNPEVVMWVRLRHKGRSIQADRFPLLMRGIALDTYQNATWTTHRYIHDSNHHVRAYPNSEPPPDPEHEIVQDVTLEPVNTRVLFYLPQLVHIESQTPNLDDILYHRYSHTLSSQHSSAVSLRYQVRSRPPSWTAAQLRQPAARPLRDYDPSGRFTQLPRSITDRTRALARAIVAGIPERQVYQRAITVQSHLKGRYRYDLDAGVRTWGVDPVEDFLFRTRAGHCEHFAAAMAVLLRCLDIPARVVTGFSDGEWNPYARVYVVRQRNAHAWVEAWVPSVEAWVTFDPTPPAPTTSSPAYGWLGSFSGRLAHLRLWWNNNVVNFSTGDQRKLARLVTDALSRLPSYLPLLGRDRLEFGGGHAAGVGAALVAAVLVLGAGLYFGGAYLLGRKFRWGWLRGRRRPGEPSVGFYRRQLELLRRRGFRRGASTTPHEFARAVIAEGGEPYRPVETVTDAFCRVRYGGQRLTAADRAAVHRALAALETRRR